MSAVRRPSTDLSSCLLGISGALVVSLFVSGCSLLSVLSPVAVEALVLGIEDADLAEHLGPSAVATAFVGRAENLDDLEANLVDDADRVLLEGGTPSLALANLGSGLYEVSSIDSPGFAYVTGSEYRLTVEDGGLHFSAAHEAPPAPTLIGVPVPPATHPAATPLTVDLSGQNFDNFLAVVVDANGSVTYDNRPQNVGEYADWITGSAGSDVITLPASAFPSPEVEYLVGIAGVERAEDGEYNGFNPLVSNLAIGAFATWPLLTSP